MRRLRARKVTENLRTARCAKILCSEQYRAGKKRFQSFRLRAMHIVFSRARVPFPLASLPCTAIIIIVFDGNGEGKKKN